jgi:hypothetical protein
MPCKIDLNIIINNNSIMDKTVGNLRQTELSTRWGDAQIPDCVKILDDRGNICTLRVKKAGSCFYILNLTDKNNNEYSVQLS